MRKKKAWKLFTLILLIALTVSIAVLIACDTENYNNTTSVIKNTVSKVAGLKSWSPTGTLVYKIGDKLIYQALSGDSKEEFNITTSDISSSTSLNGTILLMGDNQQKWNKGKKISDVSNVELTYDASPVLSPDASSIAHSSYSNAERNFGYNIMITKGSDTSSVYSTEHPVNFLRWSDDSHIVFLETNNEGVVKILDIADKEVSDIATNSNTVQALSANDKILVIATNEANNNIKVYNISNKKTILTKTNKDCIDIVVSPDSKQIAYKIQDTIEIYNLSDGNKKNIGKADKIIGWY